MRGKETLDLPILTVKSSHQRIAGRQLQKTDPPDVMTLVLAAVDDSWRDLQRTLSSLTAREMETPGVCGDWSIKDIIGHLTSREAMLLFEVATEKEAEIADTDELNRRQVEDKADTPVREIMAEFEQTHRSLKEALGQGAEIEFRIRVAHAAANRRVNSPALSGTRRSHSFLADKSPQASRGGPRKPERLKVIRGPEKCTVDATLRPATT